jgi:GNAT superfamily N-acetyltransferase
MNHNIIKRKIQRTFEDYGAKIALKKIIEFLLSPVYVHIVCRVYQIALDNLQAPEIEKRTLLFRFLNINDSKLIQQIEHMEEWLTGTLKTKLEKGNICLVALDRETVVGFNLVAFNEIYLPLVRKKEILDKDEAWSEQISVHKDYRRQLIATCLRYNIFSELKKRNIKRLYGCALIANYAALKLARRLGFEETTDIHYIRFLFYETWRNIELNGDNK